MEVDLLDGPNPDQVGGLGLGRGEQVVDGGVDRARPGGSRAARSDEPATGHHGRFELLDPAVVGRASTHASIVAAWNGAGVSAR